MSRTSPRLGIFLVEDHASFREAMSITIAHQPDMHVVAEAGTFAGAQASLTTGIDVALLDLDLPDGNGADLIQPLHKICPAAHVLVLTASAARLDVARAVNRGAAAVLHKSVSLNEVVTAVRRLGAGEWLISPAALAKIAREARLEQDRRDGDERRLQLLTRREQDVLRLLGEGLADRQMAERLHVSRETVHSHMVNLLDKLGVESRLQALIFAIRTGVVSLD